MNEYRFLEAFNQIGIGYNFLFLETCLRIYFKVKRHQSNMSTILE